MSLATLAQKAYVPKMYGNIMNMSSWSGMTDDNKPYGVYSFYGSATDFAFENVSGTSMNFYPTGNGIIANGEYNFIVRDIDYYYYDYYYQLYTYDAETWELKQSPRDVTDDYFSMDFTQDPTDGTIYNVTYKATEDWYGNTKTTIKLNKVDFATPKLTNIATLDTMFFGLAADNSGTLYGISAAGNLHKISKTDGKLTLVGSLKLDELGDSIENHLMSACFDPKTNELYFSAYLWNKTKLDFEGVLLKIDTTTGKATKVVTYPDKAQVVALSIPMPEAEDGAPAKATNLAANFVGASLTGTVTFTAPTKTFDGNTLTGNLQYAVVVNGDTLATGTTTPGSNVTANVTVPAAGVTKFVVVTSNSVGRSPEAKLTQWVGPDETTAPTDVVFSLNGTDANISWTAPDTTLHGGYFNPAELTYTIVRYPDNVTVATGVTNTYYNTTLDPATMAQYSYGVSAVNHGVNSDTTESNKLVAGPALDVPYENAISTRDEFDQLTVIDANGDKKYTESWGYVMSQEGFWNYNASYGCAVYYESSNQADDWIITPRIRLKAGNTYTLAFETRKEIERYADCMQIAYGLGYDTESYTMLIDSLKPTKEFALDSITISPVEDGEYSFGFHAISPRLHGHMMLKNISVKWAKANGLSQIEVGENQAFDIYSIDGKLIRRNATSLEGLERGIYIAGRKKVIVM